VRCSEALALRLSGLLLAALLAALTRILGLLTGLLLATLAALLAALIRVVLLMLAFFAFGRHSRLLVLTPARNLNAALETDVPRPADTKV
jgi:hypothetical protein